MNESQFLGLTSEWMFVPVAMKRMADSQLLAIAK
jgi:hypothetical protein